jgi:Fe-Mn family superoxide dismutase
MGNRREFLLKTGLLGLSGLIRPLSGASDQMEKFLPPDKFTLPPLPYGYDALEPYIDRKTMEIHHTKHHQAYIDKINSAPPGAVDFNLSDEAKCAKVDSNTPALVRNNLGGYYNHSLFWKWMKPNSGGTKNEPEGKLADAINGSFGGFDKLKTAFGDNSLKVFGSGWCWIVADKKSLKIVSTPNQDNPLMQVAAEKGKPILGLDVWEHAYYLTYQNKRVEYISAWWNVVNWTEVSRLLDES